MKHSPGFLALVEDARQRINEIDIDEFIGLRQAGEDFVLIDVREESEYGASHAAGAIHLGKGVIERDIENRIPDRNQRLILYCGGGYRSALAADAIQKMGYSQAYSLEGGWRAWKEADLPVE